MPYLDKKEMEVLQDHGIATTAGQLNFALTITCLDFLEQSEKRYADYNTVIGALESAKLEFYARMVRPYEEKKKAINGDVYPTSK